MSIENNADYLQKIKNSAKSYTVTFTAILKEISKGEDVLHCLVEGFDSCYYKSRIDQVLVEYDKFQNTKFFNCEGKETVKKIRDLFIGSEKLKNHPVIYFFDKDFDDNSLLELCPFSYITEGYSVENDISTPTCIQGLLSFSLFGDRLDNNNQLLLENAMSGYRHAGLSYIAAIEDFNAWVLAVRTKDGAGGKRTRIGHIKTSQMIKLHKTDSSLSKTYDVAFLNEKIDRANRPAVRQMKQARVQLKNMCPESDFRGHQHFDFLYMFLSEIIVMRRNGVGFFNGQPKQTKDLSKQGLFELLANYAQTPLSLIGFAREAIELRGGSKLLV